MTDLPIVCGEDWQITVSYAPDDVTAVALAAVVMDIRDAPTADGTPLVRIGAGQAGTVTYAGDSKAATLALTAVQTAALRNGPTVGYADIFATVNGRRMRLAPLRDDDPPLRIVIVPNVTTS